MTITMIFWHKNDVYIEWLASMRKKQCHRQRNVPSIHWKPNKPCAPSFRTLAVNQAIVLFRT